MNFLGTQTKIEMQQTTETRATLSIKLMLSGDMKYINKILKSPITIRLTDNGIKVSWTYHLDVSPGISIL